MIATPLAPSQSLLVLLGFAMLVGLLYLGVKIVSLKMSDWKTIAATFPAGDNHPAGTSFQQQSGVVGNIGSGSQGFFDIWLTEGGVHISPRFARKNPCLIPWSAIRRVAVSDTSLHVIVAYDRPFEFFLPANALPILQARLSAQLFHEASSPFQAARAALKDGTQSPCMSAIAGKAVQLAEREFEKEKRRHDDLA